ncbi:metalloregulator ArsR/SmtB family transcription factor [Chitinophagaceae bacterium LB-8]|uniref:Metalloregulator ArsR/SmtB family transcription factor n=1 Tax=Paraflavisolibacter caeni TaxID=2982496 RepID=A0A9X2XXK6_9BACT|nr:metalloregulator ArsR/SmtB family transcription factor [Paraflavisolibacter caeni]MCU7550606.1 metalloregulator ArsR/SmtB family transcription factor [Paraflavisolibacter caeni]
MVQTLSPEVSPLLINEMQIRKARLLLRAIDHELRQQILNYINEQGRTSVTNIYSTLKLEQSVASQHLAILRKAGCVNTIRNGKQIHYSVNYSRLQELQTIIEDFLGK